MIGAAAFRRVNRAGGLLKPLRYADIWYLGKNNAASAGPLHNKTFVVTGGNTGIGKETVKGLVLAGGNVIMGSR